MRSKIESFFLFFSVLFLLPVNQSKGGDTLSFLKHKFLKMLRILRVN